MQEQKERESNMRYLKAFSEKYLESLKCVDCDGKTEAYFVKDIIWNKLPKTKRSGSMCLSCLEKRIGRKLKKSDFKDSDIHTNQSWFSNLDENKLFETFKEVVDKYGKIYSLLDQYNIEYSFDSDGSPNIYGIEGTFTINDNGVVDVDGYVELNNLELDELPLKFGYVSGKFECNENKLTSLIGSPYEVGGYFSCCDNLLTSLEHCPSEVGEGFYCENNKLTDLDVSSIIGGDLYCGGNEIDPNNYNFYGEVKGEIIFIQ